MNIAIIGSGPTGLLMLKKLTEANYLITCIDIFERKAILGAGMPYSIEGASEEHITNVSGNEIPELGVSILEWISKQSAAFLSSYGIEKSSFNDFKVMPRLLFGRYLADQFQKLISNAKERGIKLNVHCNTKVVDIIDDPATLLTHVITHDGKRSSFDKVVICSGHFWPKKLEGKVPGCYDSPYPPEKIAMRTNHCVALRGSSLTAIDAVRTLARSNGSFKKGADGKVQYVLNPDSPNFRMMLHSRGGLLPAVRFHLEDTHLAKDSVISDEEIAFVRSQHNGFIPLDYIYKRNFLDRLANSHPTFHALVKHLPMEKFVKMMMERREQTPAFELLRAEMFEAKQSIENQESVYWKEMLAVLSFAMNYPAKYFSAEDMMRLKASLMPLISVVIAFAPQSSVVELLALHEAGVLDIVSVGQSGEIETCTTGGINYNYTDELGNTVVTHYRTFIDCIGQPHLEMHDLPYPSLVSLGTISQARLRFRDQEKALEGFSENDQDIINQNGMLFAKVPGIAINDNFQVVCAGGSANERIYMLAVPFIGGYNPDYSGLDFSEAASNKVVDAMFSGTNQLPALETRVSA